MRTTVDLPPSVHRRARELAAQNRQSLSATIAELTQRGLAALGEPTEIATDATSGLPVIRLGQRVSTAEVVEALDDA